MTPPFTRAHETVGAATMRQVRQRKYRNQPTVVDGITFASKAEARRYSELRLLERGGEISGLARQVRYPLAVNGVKVGTYVSDFDYVGRDRLQHTEDVKGVTTPLFRLKRKLFEALYDREIEIIGGAR